MRLFNAISEEYAKLILVVWFIGAMFGVVLAGKLSEASWKQKAVDAGHAEWLVTTNGKPVWRWK